MLFLKTWETVSRSTETKQQLWTLFTLSFCRAQAVCEGFRLGSGVAAVASDKN